MTISNNPPNPIDEAVAPFADYIEEAQNWLDGTKVENEDQMKAVDALLKQIKSAHKAVVDGEKSAALPLHDAWKAEKARWKPTIDDLDRIKKGLVGVVGDFKAKLAREKAEAERKAREEAERKRREAEEAARAASETDIEAQREAAAKMQEAADAQEAVKQAKDEKVKGMRTVHKYDIEDHRAALHWIAVNDRDAVTAFIEEYVRKNHKTAAIDGVRKWTAKEAY